MLDPIIIDPKAIVPEEPIVKAPPTYEEVAPEISRVIDKADFTTTYMPAVVAPVKPVAADPLPVETIEAVLTDLSDIEAANGYIGIAHRHGVPSYTVKQLHRELQAARAVIARDAAEPIEAPVEK